MEDINIGQMGAGIGDGKKSPKLIIVIVVIIIVAVGMYFWLSGEGESPTEINTVEKPQEEQTLGEQISGGATDNPASEVPQANVFETETNPFSDDGFKNPFE